MFFAKLEAAPIRLIMNFRITHDFETYWMAQAYLNYNKTIKGNHTITGVLGVKLPNNDFTVRLNNQALTS